MRLNLVLCCGKIEVLIDKSNIDFHQTTLHSWKYLANTLLMSYLIPYQMNPMLLTKEGMPLYLST